MALRLTDRVLRLLPAPAKGNRIYYDDLVKGFGCRVTAAGARAFVVNYRRKADGLERRLTIGSAPEWTVAAAREAAKSIKREVDFGADPIGEQREAREAATVADLCERFALEVISRKRPFTQRDYRRHIAVTIRPALGRMKVASVTFADIDALHRKLSVRAPTQANRVLALLSRLFSMAIKWDLRTDNPCRGVERNQEHKRQRYLTGPELGRVTTALADMRDRGAANAIMLLLLTGSRTGETLRACWRDIDFETKTWTKPAHSTKQARLHHTPLSEAACKLLAEMRQQAGANAEFLFAAPQKSGPRTTLQEPWQALRTAAAIPDVRLHDLRHSYASILASSGLSLPIIGSMLGHTTASTTMRYSHLMMDVQRRAAETASAAIAGKPAAVVPRK